MNDMSVKIVSLPKRLVLSVNIVFYLFAFLIPFAISGPQLLVGSVVNTFLFITAAKLDKKSILLVAILPSLGAFSHGVIFGPLTFFLFYFLPFIWIGNLLLIYVFKQYKNILLAAGVKTAFLFLTANIYHSFQIVPKLFVTSMGLFQFVTALIGGVLALVLFKINERTR